MHSSAVLLLAELLEFGLEAMHCLGVPLSERLNSGTQGPAWLPSLKQERLCHSLRCTSLGKLVFLQSWLTGMHSLWVQRKGQMLSTWCGWGGTVALFALALSSLGPAALLWHCRLH